MILDFSDTKGEILQKLENYRRLLVADCFGWIMRFGLSVIMSNIDNYIISDS
mgnify:CR=1 FL=1